MTMHCIATFLDGDFSIQVSVITIYFTRIYIIRLSVWNQYQFN